MPSLCCRWRIIVVSQKSAINMCHAADGLIGIWRKHVSQSKNLIIHTHTRKKERKKKEKKKAKLKHTNTINICQEPWTKLKENIMSQ